MGECELGCVEHSVVSVQEVDLVLAVYQHHVTSAIRLPTHSEVVLGHQFQVGHVQRNRLKSCQVKNPIYTRSCYKIQTTLQQNRVLSSYKAPPM